MDNEIDRKIDVTAILFLLVQNRWQTHDWTLIGSGANGLGMQECTGKGRYIIHCIRMFHLFIPFTRTQKRFYTLNLVVKKYWFFARIILNALGGGGKLGWRVFFIVFSPNIFKDLSQYTLLGCLFVRIQLIAFAEI